MPKNRYVEAFKETHNVVGLAAISGISLAMLSPVPVLVGLVAETAYMLFVPDSGWFQAKLHAREREREAQEAKADQERRLAALSGEMRERYLRLETLRTQIRSACSDHPEWFNEILTNIDFLLEKFLVFASKEIQLREYLNFLRKETRAQEVGKRSKNRSGMERYDLPDVDLGGGSVAEVETIVAQVQARFDQDRAHLLDQSAQERDDGNRLLLQKRIEIIERRQEFLGKSSRILIGIYHQLELLEDTLGLINDEIRARGPEQILADMESVVTATHSMTTALDELAPYEQMMVSN